MSLELTTPQIKSDMLFQLSHPDAPVGPFLKGAVVRNYHGAHFILTFDLWKEQLGLISGFGFPPQIRRVQFMSISYDVSILNIFSQVNQAELLSMEV